MLRLVPDFDALDRFYARRLGSPPVVTAAESEELPDLTLQAFETGDADASWTVATRGMSGRAMHVPEGAEVLDRAELITYVPEPSHAFTWWMSWLATFPFIDRTWLGYGHTVYQQEPLFRGSALQHLLLLPSLVAAHRDMDEHVTVAGDPVGLWWVVPITDAERELKMAKGVDALLDRFEEAQLPLTVDPSRQSLA